MSAAFRLEATFIEAQQASVRNKREGENDAQFARICLDTLREVAKIGGPSEQLLMRMYATFSELVLSSEPYIGAPEELRTPWFEVARRVRNEKRHEKTKVDQLLFERQQQVEALRQAEELARAADHDRAVAVALAEQRCVVVATIAEKGRVAVAPLQPQPQRHSYPTSPSWIDTISSRRIDLEHTSLIVASLQEQLAEQTAQAASTTAVLCKRLEQTQDALAASQSHSELADVADARRQLAASQAASDAAKQVHSRKDELATMHAQLRALQLAMLSNDRRQNTTGVAAKLHAELHALDSLRAAGTTSMEASAQMLVVQHLTAVRSDPDIGRTTRARARDCAPGSARADRPLVSQ